MTESMLQTGAVVWNSGAASDVFLTPCREAQILGLGGGLTKTYTFKLKH